MIGGRKVRSNKGKNGELMVRIVELVQGPNLKGIKLLNHQAKLAKSEAIKAKNEHLMGADITPLEELVQVLNLGVDLVNVIVELVVAV